MEGVINTFREVGWSGLLDIAGMSLLIYMILAWFKRTRAAFVLTGIIIMSVVYVLARQMGLMLMASVLKAFFAVILVALVVIFQEELRHFFEQIAVWSLNRRVGQWRKIRTPRKEVEILVRTVTDFAEDRIGSLIVLHGRNPILRHLSGGIDLDGELSEPLLKSLFDPHSIGHDGALIISRGRVLEFSSHLPLSKNFQKLQHLGTRHAAALGLSELTDALCLVVSEEQGTISAVRHGEIRQIGDPEALTRELEKFYEEVHPRKQGQEVQESFSRNSREIVLAVFMSMALWFFLVHESKIVQKTYAVPVETSEIAPSLEVTGVTPGSVSVVLSGARRAFYFADDAIKLRVHLHDIAPGKHIVPLSYSDFRIPAELNLEYVDPRQITVQVGGE